MPKVSVIVPIYSVEKYIERCARSLFEQTLDEIEYIFVDDCTPDNSIEILEKTISQYPQRQTQIKILHHEINKGRAAARTTGMKSAKGEYMIHCDPDDWVEPDAYQTLFEKARYTEADIVTAPYNNPWEGSLHEGTGITALLNVNYSLALWDKLIRTSLIQEYNIYPFENIEFGEDTNVIIRAYTKAKRVSYITKPIYHYNTDNDDSICKDGLRKNISRYGIANVYKIEEYLQKECPKYVRPIISYLKLYIKNPLLVKDTQRDLDFWLSVWKESNRFMKSYPRINKRERVKLYYLSHFEWLLKLYYSYINFRSKSSN